MNNVSVIAIPDVLDLGGKEKEIVIVVRPAACYESSDNYQKLIYRLSYVFHQGVPYSVRTLIRLYPGKKAYKLADLHHCLKQAAAQSLELGVNLKSYLAKEEPFFATAQGSRLLNEVFAGKGDKKKCLIVLGFVTMHIFWISGEFINNGNLCEALNVRPTRYATPVRINEIIDISNSHVKQAITLSSM